MKIKLKITSEQFEINPRVKFTDSLIKKPFFLDEVTDKKTNYSPEEIELVKHNINQREVTEQGSELLKFNKLVIINSEKEVLDIFENNLKERGVLKMWHECLVKERRYKLAKLFKNQIEILDGIESLIKNNKSAK